MKSLRILVVISSLLLGHGLGAQSNFTSLYLDFLEKESIPAQIDRDGDIEFDLFEKTFYILIEQDDPGFFRMVLPNIWPIENDKEYLTVLKACNQANKEAKAVKIYTTNDNVWLATELLLEKPEQFTSIFYRALDEMEHCLEVFLDAM